MNLRSAQLCSASGKFGVVLKLFHWLSREVVSAARGGSGCEG